MQCIGRTSEVSVVFCHGGKIERYSEVLSILLIIANEFLLFVYLLKKIENS